MAVLELIVEAKSQSLRQKSVVTNVLWFRPGISGGPPRGWRPVVLVLIHVQVNLIPGSPNLAPVQERVTDGGFQPGGDIVAERQVQLGQDREIVLLVLAHVARQSQDTAHGRG